jgi:hypothetical protein
MSAKDNKFLKVNSNVVLNPLIEKVVCALDKHFEKANQKALVTSGVRTPVDQLRIIRQYLVSEKLASKYPEALTGEVTDKVGENYVWQMGWSALLNHGIIINPPLKAKLLMNYFNASGVNRIGDYFNQTAHSNGACVDIGGGANGLNDELAVVSEAKKEIPEIVNWVIERNNNCLHLNLKAI